ncbi:WD40 repeat domain-containing protein [Porphyrobacter sp. YT40]|uniref:TolB family protein n=1 Tax=Porphyrobacter sp. YT40 TaxID=2547601 RepID=UPI0015E8AB7D|nr:WD40 repeat domain-containing protein [Porphyrobacter sp. YT40]
MRDVKVSPDSRQVAFIAKDRSAATFALYVVPIEGGTPLRVSQDGQRNVSSFDWAPDSQRLVYAGNFNQVNPVEAEDVYVVRRDGSGRAGISGSLGNPPSLSISNPVVSPDGRFVLTEVFAASSSGVSSAPIGYNSYPINGSPGVILQREVNGQVRNGTWSSDSSKVCFAVAPNGRDFRLSYRNVPDPGQFDFLITENSDLNDTCAWDSTGNVVAYVQRASSTSGGSLRTRNLQTGVVTTLAEFGGSSREIGEFRYNPADDRQIAFLGNFDTPTNRHLFIAATDRNAPVRISPALQGGRRVIDYAWSPDGRWIAYLADTDNDGLVEAIRVRVSDTATVFFEVPGYDAKSLHWAPDASRLVFSAGVDVAGSPATRLYSVRSGSNEVTPVIDGGLIAIGAIDVASPNR